jgi:AcrR family transcriptional regulator
LSPLSEEQLEHLRDERKERIMEAAVRVFARYGISGAKMSMIATEAGSSHGLLYHYFKSKDELFTAVVRDAMETAFQAVGSIYEIPGSPFEKLTILTEIILDKDNAPYFMLMYVAHSSDDVPEETRKLLSQYPMRGFVDLLLPFFVEGQQAGEIAAGNPHDLINWYFSTISGLMVVNFQDKMGYSMPDVAVLLRMFKAP